MKDEIKEILDYFQKDVDKYEESKKYLMQKYGYDEETIDNISQHERHINTKKLLDYITNLQTIEKLYDNKLSENKLLKRELTNLQQKNERLRNHIQMIPYLQTVREKDDYKSRCEKAIVYIKEMLYPTGTCVNGSDLPYESIESLLNILQNGSDDNE